MLSLHEAGECSMLLLSYWHHVIIRQVTVSKTCISISNENNQSWKWNGTSYAFCNITYKG